MLVLGLDQEFGRLLVLPQVHGHLDHGEAVEEVGKLLGLVSDHLLSRLAEMPVPGRDLDLHE